MKRRATIHGILATVMAVAILTALGSRRASAQVRDPHVEAADDGLGARVYQERCARCHKARGEGVPGVYPPLAGSPFVTAAPELALRVVLAGRASSAEPPQMPAFASVLDDEETAAVLTYVRRHWGNDAGAVDVSAVASMRDDVEPLGHGASGVHLPSGWRAEGARTFERYCQACHQPEGEGIFGVYPPLAGNPVVTSAPRPLVRIVMDGRGGMPAFAHQLDDGQLARVLSYIRTSWGNDATVVSPELVGSMERPGRGH